MMTCGVLSLTPLINVVIFIEIMLECTVLLRGLTKTDKISMETLICDRWFVTERRKVLGDGEPKKDHKPITRVMCQAKIRFHYDLILQKWWVTKFEETHNHDLIPPKYIQFYWKNELLSDFKSLFTTPVLTTCLQDIEKQVADIFTRSMFKEVRCEIEEAGKLNVVTQSVSNNEVKVRINKYRQPGRECEVQYDKATKKFACDCRLFESRGIPCCHIFCTMRHDHIDIIPDTLVCTRYGALATLCFTLCESASKNRDDFMEIRDDIFGLIQKLKKRRDPDSNVLSNACMVGDPTIVKTKESPRQNRLAVKSRKCSHCTRHGHTIRRCPKLYSRDILHTGHHQSSDELNDVKSYSEEETNHQSNHENNVQSVDHRYFSDNGTNKLATQKNKNGVKATEDTRVNDTSLKSKKYKRRCSNIHNAYKSGQPNNHDTGKTCQPNPIDPLKLQNQHLNGLPVYPTFPEFSIPSYHPYNGTLLYQSYSPYYYNVANGNLFWNGEVHDLNENRKQ
ncbi:hypothetical protein Ahy_B08g091278 [Arachis hypogaea]|uniref:SWIM-type domain-containing protein n=1 Tax=Arachis hypogaea TaxID=3818 RepID=A0A444Y1V7_ARAHY|nr:hypothetical protein Ahy_B08g091278 [Arachis hypogaea]